MIIDDFIFVFIGQRHLETRQQYSRKKKSRKKVKENRIQQKQDRYRKREWKHFVADKL